MEKMIAKWGLDCCFCPTFIATKNNNDELRQETAKNWSKVFGASIKLKDINCI